MVLNGKFRNKLKYSNRSLLQQDISGPMQTNTDQHYKTYA